MRVISGVHKGRRIQAPKNLPVRPTTDRSKEGLFNILQHRLDFKSIKVLDLFAGTGSISYEFSSRGTKYVSAIDQNKSCVQFIQKTATALEMKIIAIQGECLRFLEQNSFSYDLIFADPPYNIEIHNYEKIILLSRQCLSKKGIIIIEHFKQTKLSEIQGFSFERVYGNSVFSFFYL
jgi:16S rRNA (guanine(966)-N(2))-methyltransferase RsmD